MWNSSFSLFVYFSMSEALLQRVKELEAELEKLKSQLEKRSNDAKPIPEPSPSSAETNCPPTGNAIKRGKKAVKNRPLDFFAHPRRHVALRLAYLGWAYQGFAVQENTDNTVEARLFEALHKTCLIQDRQSSNYHRCGRTDKGVSAFSQVTAVQSLHTPPFSCITVCVCISKLVFSTGHHYRSAFHAVLWWTWSQAPWKCWRRQKKSNRCFWATLCEDAEQSPATRHPDLELGPRSGGLQRTLRLSVAHVPVLLPQRVPECGADGRCCRKVGESTELQTQLNQWKLNCGKTAYPTDTRARMTSAICAKWTWATECCSLRGPFCRHRSRLWTLSTLPARTSMTSLYLRSGDWPSFTIRYQKIKLCVSKWHYCSWELQADSVVWLI